jgi:hypothetical protein
VLSDDCGVTIKVLLELVTKGIAPVEVAHVPALTDAGPAMVVLPSDKPKFAGPPGSVMVRVRAVVSGVDCGVIVNAGFAVEESPRDSAIGTANFFTEDSSRSSHPAGGIPVPRGSWLM